ncbi:MAG: diguanylate cyclase, partial [Dyella sp.]|nr:diguanylate cyclase [Dyella sp.]MBV8270655.1 diguanylate cyclase [Cupriavidus sp.]
MNLNKTLTMPSRYLWPIAVVLPLFAATFASYLLATYEADHTQEARRKAFLVAEALRQSSDDLTRMARTYVVTGDTAYRRKFDEILEAREGKRARPRDYENIYWDLLLRPGDLSHLTPGSRPLLERTRESGFTAEEVADMEAAKRRSDALTATEYAAMALVQSGKADETGKRQALMMLHDEAYNSAKAAIMNDIGGFYRKVDARTLSTVQTAEDFVTRLRLAFVLLGIAVIGLLAGMRQRTRRVLGAPAEELHACIARLGTGDFSQSLNVPRGKEFSVLGWLAETQGKLAGMDAERRRAEEETRQLAHFDPLTGLPNRLQLQRYAAAWIGRAQRERGTFTLMVLDLDHFKEINDTLGHSMGDGLLVGLAKRMQRLAGPDETVGRLSGDEFVFLLYGASEARANQLAGQVLRAMAEPYYLGHHELTVTASIGISRYPRDGEDLESLSRRADAAMYHVKREGRAAYGIYFTDLEVRATRRLNLANALRHALPRNQLHVVYQPQVS